MYWAYGVKLHVRQFVFGKKKNFGSISHIKINKITTIEIFNWQKKSSENPFDFSYLDVLP